MKRDLVNNLEYDFNPQSDIVMNPIPILQQEKANLTTNTFLLQKNQEPVDLVKNERESERDLFTFNKINEQLSISVIGFMDDCLNKPDHIKWHHYMPIIVQKDNRYTYLLILLIFITLFIILLG